MNKSAKLLITTMSIQDVCDLSSMLQVDEMEKDNLMNRILSDEANIKLQEGRLQHELEEKNRIYGLRLMVADRAKTILHGLEIHSLKVNEIKNESSTKVEDFKNDVEVYLGEVAEMKQNATDLLKLLAVLGTTVAEEEKESLTSLQKTLEHENKLQVEYVLMTEERIPRIQAAEKKLIDVGNAIIHLKENIETKKNEIENEKQRMGLIESEIKTIQTDGQKLIDNAKQEKKELDSKSILSSEALEKEKLEAAKLKSTLQGLQTYIEVNSNNDAIKRGAELDECLIQYKAQRAEVINELALEKEKLVENDSSFNNMQGELKLLGKEIEIEKLKEQSLEKNATFTDTADSLFKEFQDKGKIFLDMKSENASLKSDLNETSADNIRNEEMKLLLISIEENERKKIDLIKQLKHNQLDEELPSDEIASKLESVLQQKEEVTNSIVSLRTQMEEGLLQQNRIPVLECELEKFEGKLTNLRATYQTIIDKIAAESETLKAENFKIMESKKKEDELWIAREIESRYNIEMMKKTQEHQDALHQLNIELKEVDAKFLVSVKLAEERNEQEFEEEKKKFVAILNELTTLGIKAPTLQEELMLESNEAAERTRHFFEEPPKKSARKDETPIFSTGKSTVDDVPVGSRSRLRLNSQSASQANSQSKPKKAPKVAEGRENEDPASAKNSGTSRKYGGSGSQSKAKSQSWLDSDDDDVFGATFKASQGPKSQGPKSQGPKK